jgi:hypothetical protein
VVLVINFPDGRRGCRVDGIFDGVPGMVDDGLGFSLAYWVSVGSEYFFEGVFQFGFGGWVFVVNGCCVLF